MVTIIVAIINHITRQAAPLVHSLDTPTPAPDRSSNHHDFGGAWIHGLER
jgi:hypothetical protein